MSEVMRALGRIEGTVDAVLREQIAVGHKVHQLERVQAERAGELRSSKKWAASIAAAVSALVALLSRIWSS